MANREGKVYVFDHPLIQHKTALMRDVNTSVKEFRELATEVAMLMASKRQEICHLKRLISKHLCARLQLRCLREKIFAIVPILRAGLGFVDGMLALVPNAKVGHVGLYRDPDTHLPVEYYASCLQTSRRERFSLLTQCLQLVEVLSQQSILSRAEVGMI